MFIRFLDFIVIISTKLSLFHHWFSLTTIECFHSMEFTKVLSGCFLLDSMYVGAQIVWETGCKTVDRIRGLSSVVTVDSTAAAK